MQVQWHGREGRHGRDKGILTIQLKAELAHNPERVTNPHAQVGVVLRLNPGINDNISRESWESALKLGVVQAHIASGNLAVIEADDLKKFPPAEAIQMSKETIDLNLLKKWKDGETRPEIIKAIDDQVDKMLDRKPEEPPPAQQPWQR